jgi:hypothetical protein
MLIDSKVQKPQEKKETGPVSSYIGETAGLGQQMQNTGQTVRNPGLQRRGSDNIGPGGNPSDPNAPGMPQGMPGMQQPPGAMAGGNMMPNGQPMPGQPIPGRPHWFVSTDGKNQWMYAPPLDTSVPVTR